MHSFNDLAFVREKFRCQGKITGSGLGYIDMDLIGDMSRTPGQDIDPVREQDRLINIMGDRESWRDGSVPSHPGTTGGSPIW